MTLKDQVIFDLPCWDKVSKDAKNFILGLLRKDPSKRLTMNEVFEHNWF
jgi:serine/threonine protein kinase